MFHIGDISDMLGMQTENKTLNEKSNEVNQFLETFDNLDDDMDDDFVGGIELASSSDQSMIMKMLDDLERENQPKIALKSNAETGSQDSHLLLKKNTKWAVKMFQEWHVEATQNEVNFTAITCSELNEKPRQFYAEVQPRNKSKRSEKMTTEQAAEYHRNTLKNVRSALNRHLNDIGRDMDIVRDKEFRGANAMLDGKLKLNVRHGLSRPTKHKEIIEPQDLMKISTYLHSSMLNPMILRFRVWHFLSVHFVTRGLEFHQQLTTKSFEFRHDENNVEYAALTHETKQKNHQGGIDANAPSTGSDKRMYSTSNDFCPVKSLKLLIEKTHPNAKSLFNHCVKDAVTSPDKEQYWYNITPVKQYQFTRFMSDISRQAKLSKTYTAHCLRATSIQAMSDAGCELRHIMFMSGHRNEASVRSYSRNLTTNQKRQISSTLSSVFHEIPATESQPQSESAMNPFRPLPLSVQNNNLPPAPSCRNTHTFNAASFSQHRSQNVLSSGLFSNSAFNNCVFNINPN